MDWIIQKVDGGTLCTARCARLDDDTVVELWTKYRQVVPLQSKPWDYVRVELWDQGRVLVFPASTRTENRIDNVTCQLYVDELREREGRVDPSSADAATLFLAIDQECADALAAGIAHIPHWSVDVRIFVAGDPGHIRRVAQ